MVDLLGPGDAGAPRTVGSTDANVIAELASPNAADTFFADCVANVPGTGTPINQKWANRLLQQVRRLIRFSGVTLNNANDDMLTTAVQYVVQNGQTVYVTDSGTANAVVIAPSPTPTGYPVGMELNVLKGANQNTGAMTVNGAAVTWPDGSALTYGAWPANTPGKIIKTVAGWALFGGSRSGALIARRIFTTTQTYTPTAGTNKVRVTVGGAGGAGGGSDAMSASQFAAGGGGGAGEVATQEYTSGFSGVTMTIGAAGTGSSGASGGSGGTTSFGALLTAAGGAGGAKATAQTFASVQAGGAAGTGGTGAALYRSPGQPGATGIALATANGCSGFGGSSYMGAGASAVYSNTLAGWTSLSLGAGGSGAYGSNSGAAQPGGNGGGGWIIVEEYA